MHRQTLSDRTLIITVAVATVALAAAASQAMIAPPNLEPADRLIPRIQTYIEAHPDDAAGHYALARVHYLAAHSRTGVVAVWLEPQDDEATLPRIVPEMFDDWAINAARNDHARALMLKQYEIEDTGRLNERQRRAFNQTQYEIANRLKDENWRPESLDAAVLAEHTRKAIAACRKAIELLPTDGLYHQGLGLALEQQAGQVEPEMAKPLILEALAAYRKAFELTAEADRQRQSMPPLGVADLVSYNAGRAWLRLAKDMGIKVDKKETEAMQQHITRIQQPRGPLATP